MNIIKNIIQDVPLFKHCSDEEISYLVKISRPTTIKKNKQLDIKISNFFTIIINGIFEIEDFGKTDIVYLSPGSFFGNIPFSSNRHRGNIKALVDSTILVFEVDELYKFFLMYYKSLRGYLKTISKMGFEISSAGAEYSARKSKVITVCSSDSHSGKSLLAALTGLALAKHNKTIVLDLSYEGTSVFNYYEKKITSPLSQKQVTGPGVEKLLNDRIETIHDNLDLINITFGSKVKIDPQILSPVLFILSRTYKYIVLDISDYDSVLRNYTFKLSDYIFTLIKKEKDMSQLHTLFDSTLREGQRVYYVINEYYSGEMNTFLGGLLFEKILFANGIGLQAMAEYVEKGVVESITAKVLASRKALVFESNMLESVFFTGFLNAYRTSDANGDILCGGSFSFIILMMYHLSQNNAEFIKKVKTFFSEEKINKFLDVTFPDEYIFKAAGFTKFARELAGDKRLEDYEHAPLTLLYEERKSRGAIFSTGYIKDLLAASFLVHPIFESITIADDVCHSGFPETQFTIEKLFRTDIEKITYVSVDNKEICDFRSNRVLPFYRKYIYSLASGYNKDKINDLADKNLVIEVAESELRIEKIIEITEKIGENLLKGGI